MSDEPKEPKKIKCPCCGQLTLTPPLDINTELTDHYLSCIMTGVPFHHTYPLYDGKIKITISVLSSEDMLTIDSAVTFIKDKLDSTNNDVYDQLGGMIRAYAFVSNVECVGKTTKVYTPASSMLSCAQDVLKLRVSDEPDIGLTPEAAEELLKKYKNNDILSPLPFPMLEAVCKTHITIYNILTETGFDPNFWKGIELA